MATIRIPTPLRKLTQGKEEVTAQRRDDRRAHRQPRDAVPRHQGAHLRRQRPGAPLREHLRQRRGHPLPQEPRDAGQGQRRDLDRPGDRGRLSVATWSPTSLATRARSRCPRSAPTDRSASAPRACGRRRRPRGRDRGVATCARPASAQRDRPRRRRAGRRRQAWLAALAASISSCAPASTTTRCCARPAPRAAGDRRAGDAGAVDVLSFRAARPCPTPRSTSRRRPPSVADGAAASSPARWPPPRRCSLIGARRRHACDGGRIRHLRLPARRRRAAGRRSSATPDERADADAIRRARLRVAERITDLIGDTPHRAPARVRARHARRRDLGQVRVHEPGRLGQGSRRATR